MDSNVSSGRGVVAGSGSSAHRPHRRAPRLAAADHKGKRTATAPPPPPPASGEQQQQRKAPPASGGGGGSSPCGACKFLRRKCVAGGCVFAPYFRTEQGPAKFAVVHKIFGASNVSKMLMKVPASRRHEAVATICYEAQARLADPVYGCVSTILALQQQVASMQAELSIVHSQLMNKRMAVIAATADDNIHGSGNSSVSTNLVNNARDFLLGLDQLGDYTAEPPPLHRLRRRSPSQGEE